MFSLRHDNHNAAELDRLEDNLLLRAKQIVQRKVRINNLELDGSEGRWRDARWLWPRFTQGKFTKG